MIIQNFANKLAYKFQKQEESKFHHSVILNMDRVIQLNRYSCGLQTALVILKYYRKIKSIDEIPYDRKLIKKEGIDTEPLLNLIKSKGVKVEVNEKADLDDIKDALRNAKPMFISIDEGEHWVVIYGFGHDRIFVLDSALTSSLNCSWSYDDFLERWDENWIAVCSN